MPADSIFKLSMACTHQAQSLLELGRAIESLPVNHRGESIMPRKTRRLMIGALVKNAELLDVTAVLLDAQVPIIVVTGK